MMHSSVRRTAVSLAAGLLLMAPPLAAETINCTGITAVPYTITSPGLYCLTADLSTSRTTGAAISIEANSVVLDLNGHRIGGLAAGRGTEAVGIQAHRRQNITIKNGTIRGFKTGIVLSDDPPHTTSLGHLIEDVRLDQNTFIGIQAKGHAMVIRGNHVLATGGTTTFGPTAAATGIEVWGPGNRVIDNDVVTVTKQGGSLSFGINLLAAIDALAVNNRITEADRGVSFGFSTGKYRDNVTVSVGLPYVGTGTNAGNNN